MDRGQTLWGFVLLLGLLTQQAMSVPSARSIRDASSGSCAGRRIFMHELPRKFNLDLLYNGTRDAEAQYSKGVMDHLQLANINNGLGKKIENVGGMTKLRGVWYNTDQNSLENIFYHRMRSYPCRVGSFQEADLVYIPYFGAHDTLRTMGTPKENRDSLARDLLTWLRHHPAWQRRSGRDHFLVLGSPLWDYFRSETGDWGSILLQMEGVKDNVLTVLTERGWAEPSIFSSPQPTGFHPRFSWQLKKWQRHVLGQERKHLFALATGHRNKELAEGILREKLFWQCARAREACGLLDCDKPGSDCLSVNSFFSLYLSSKFCLHPIGDSCTRRAVLDAALAGCIPVVFKECTLQTQFHWHLQDHAAKPHELFVYIPIEAVRGDYALPVPGSGVSANDGFAPNSVLVEDILKKIPESEVEAMRRRVVDLLPKITYGGRLKGGAILPPGFKDAVDVIVEGLAEKAKASV